MRLLLTICALQLLYCATRWSRARPVGNMLEIASACTNWPGIPLVLGSPARSFAQLQVAASHLDVARIFDLQSMRDAYVLSRVWYSVPSAIEPTFVESVQSSHNIICPVSRCGPLSSPVESSMRKAVLTMPTSELSYSTNLLDSTRGREAATMIFPDLAPL